MRSDWAEKFRRLMHWNQTADIDRVDSRAAVIVLRDGSDLSKADFSTRALDDVLRASIMLIVSGLDRYVHERVVKGIVPALRNSNRNRTQEEFSIPASLTLEVTRALQEASRKGETLRPANEVRKKVQEIVHLRPFQSWREIVFAFELLGITDLAGQLQAAYGIGDIGLIRDELDSIIRRRNWIVHEGDLVRHKRGGDAKLHAVTPAFVRQSLGFVDDLASKLDEVSF